MLIKVILLISVQDVERVITILSLMHSDTIIRQRELNLLVRTKAISVNVVQGVVIPIKLTF